MTSSDPINPSSTNLSFITDKQLNIVFCNKDLYSLLGVFPDIVIGQYISCLHKVIDEKECLRVTRHLVSNSGSYGKIVEDNHGKITGWEVIVVYGSDKQPLGFWFNEINTEKKELAKIINQGNISANDYPGESLQFVRSEQQFRSLSENVPGAVYEYSYHKDGSSGFKYLSSSVFKLFQISVEKFTGSFDHIVVEDRPLLFNAIRHSSDTNQPFYFEGRLKTGNGNIKWHSASSSFSYMTEGGSRVFTGIIQDITERKMTEIEKQKNDSRFRLALTKVGDNFWEHNFLKNETFFRKQSMN